MSPDTLEDRLERVEEKLDRLEEKVDQLLDWFGIREWAERQAPSEGGGGGEAEAT